jgi:hypothetical protein
VTTPYPNACAEREKERASLKRSAGRVHAACDTYDVRDERVTTGALIETLMAVRSAAIALADAVIAHVDGQHPPGLESDALHAAARAYVAVSREPISMADASRTLRIGRELGKACQSLVEAETRGGLS